MNERQRRREALVAQVVVIRAQLVRQEHALIDNRAAGQGDDIEAVVPAVGLAEDGIGNDLTQHIELALELRIVRNTGAAPNEDLPVHGLCRDNRLRQTTIVDRHIPPTENLLAFRRGCLFDDCLAMLPQGFVRRHEDMANAIMTGLRQGEIRASRSRL